MRLAARIEGIGLLGPGLASWQRARETLAGRAPYVPADTVIPAPEALPPVERRRAGPCVRLALAAGSAAAADAGRSPRDLAAIFASSTGDGENLHAICETLASDDRLISPTRFHNSVHNAPAGYWGIATGSMRPADSLAAFDASFGAGLLEALGRIVADPAQPVLLIAYDAPYPEPLHAARPVAGAFAVGLVLAADGAASGSPHIAMDILSGTPGILADSQLEQVRRGIPAARALPLLMALARGGHEHVLLEYLDGLALAVDVRP